jgi:hypothetical protein
VIIFDADVSLAQCAWIETHQFEATLDAGGNGVAAALIRQGLVPCAPFRPTIAVLTRVLELYRVTHIRCPQLAVQSFCKSLSDLHEVSQRFQL